MPGKLRRNDYDLVEEAYDSKSPVHSEDAFEHGITFKVKYIGTKEIHKPSSRAEIVAAMRRIRYEYKMYGARKERTELTVAVSGIKVIRKEEVKRGWMSQKKKDFGETEVMYHPINRIFYVSHDSQDLQIFSFIAKEDDVFRCSVFKANNKSDAVHIVRTIGQAFEVSHRRTLSQQEDVPEKTESEQEEKKLDIPMETASPSPEGLMDLSGDLSWENKDHRLISDPGMATLTIQQLRQIYQQQLDHQRHETQAALAQVKLLTQQLNAEAETRQELQNQLDQVLRQNKQLVITIQQLVDQVQVLQSQARGRGDSGVSLSLDMDGRNTSVTSNSSQAPMLPVVLPVKTGSVVLAPSLKLRNLGEPVLPHIPPPANTPSPVMSHHSDTDAFDGSFSSLQSSSKVESVDSFIRNGGAPEHSPLPTLVDLSSSESEMVEPRKEPIPQQFLQFVFDSRCSPSTPGVVTPGNSLQRNNKNKAGNASLGQNMGEKPTVLNGTF